MRKSIVIFFIITLVFTAGCNVSNAGDSVTEPTAKKTYANFEKGKESEAAQKDIHTTDAEGSDSVDDSAMYDLAKANGMFITIEDFDIETDKSKPLRTTKLDNGKFCDLISCINSTNRLSSDVFRLYHMTFYDEWLCFRGLPEYKDQWYYCVIENTDTQDKMYLFFSPFEKTWSIKKYVAVDKDGKQFSDSEYGSVAMLNVVADVDK